MTKNKEYSDFGLGDRTLAIWQAQGYYHFTTFTTDNPNLMNNINYGDIEGVWTFIYFSYSLEE